jgi:hypothetical protein
MGAVVEFLARGRSFEVDRSRERFYLNVESERIPPTNWLSEGSRTADGRREPASANVAA